MSWLPARALAPSTVAGIARAWWARGQTFEYWAHAACVLPVELWPLFAWRRRRYQRRYPRTPEQREILAQVRDLGAATIGDLGGARISPGWWEWSPVKQSVEQLLARGEVVCTERRGFRRVYRVTEYSRAAAVARRSTSTTRPASPGWLRWPPRTWAWPPRTTSPTTFACRSPRCDARRGGRRTGPRQRWRGWARRAWAHPPRVATVAPTAPSSAGAALAVQLPDLAPAAHGEALRLPPPPRGVHARRQARARLLRHATARRWHGSSGRVDPKRDGAVLRARRVSLGSRSP